MTPMSRREFTQKIAICSGAAGLLVASAAKLAANPLGLPIGCQVWPMRSMLKDFPAFVKMLAGIGVTRLELFANAQKVATQASQNPLGDQQFSANLSYTPTATGSGSTGTLTESRSFYQTSTGQGTTSSEGTSVTSTY